jgi:hypothetical protein
MVAGDFNGDGHLDLATAAYGQNAVFILLGNGDGTFQPAKQFAVGQTPYNLVAGDFNGDGRLDLAVANESSNDVSILLGNGDGTFQPARKFAVGVRPTSVAVGDFNGDGKADLAVANDSSGGVSILLGNGDGTFQSAQSYGAGLSDQQALVAGDFNGDGKVDLALSFAREPGQVAILLGNGDGTFRQASENRVGFDPYGLVAGDFNGDGRLDLATANNSTNDVSVVLGNGDGTFADGSLFATALHAAPLVADVNGDGTKDVLVVDGTGSILYRQGVPRHVGAFDPPVVVNAGAPSRDICWIPDTAQGPLLASVDARDEAVSLLAWRDGAFVRLGSLPAGQLPAQIISADLNGDGWSDLVVRNAGDGTLSVYFGAPFSRSGILGPINPSLIPPRFLPPLILLVGQGVSDVHAIDTTGSGLLDLVVTNKVSGQVGILHNLGSGVFGPLQPYRAGTGLSSVDDSSGQAKVTSLEETASMAAGPLTASGQIELLTANPGSETLGILAGLGGGRFANPVAIQTPHPAQIIRLVDLNHDGIPDLVLLGSSGVSVMLGDGKGSFGPPVTYDAGSEPTGLTVADLTGNGIPDLVISNAYGDVLLLVGKGDGTFSPYREADQSITLAVADLTGSSAKDVIYADQGLDRVVVDYGAGGSNVLGDSSTGLLSPGAVKLADLNGDGIPDLIVANSGSNNVLIYLGLGNGQFGPAINDGHGYFVGTNPVGITVANLTGPLPDLVVADKGSNQVSILLNKTQPGGPISFDAGPRLNSGGVGPVSTVVGNFTPGSANPDILVTNSGSNNVALLPGVGGGFFNDTNPQTFVVGTNPGPLFVGNFDSKPDLVTVNAGSNDLTLISNFMGSEALTLTIPSGGTDPVAAFSFSSGSGFDNLVVGNGGNGVLALFEGSEQGLTLTSTETSPELPSPSALVFAGVGGGQVHFYAATEGREAAALVALSLGAEIAPLTSPSASATPVVAQLVPLQETSLALVGTLLIATIDPQAGEAHLGSVEPEAEAAVALTVSSAAPPGVGQGVSVPGSGGETGGGGDEPEGNPEAQPTVVPAPSSGPSWQRLILRPEEAIQKFNRQHPELFPSSGDEQPEANPPAENSHIPAPIQQVVPQGQRTSSPAEVQRQTIDHAIEVLNGPDLVALERFIRIERQSAAPGHLSMAVACPTWEPTVPELLRRTGTAVMRTPHFPKPGHALTHQHAKLEVSASLALAATVAGWTCVRTSDRRARKRPFLTLPRR